MVPPPPEKQAVGRFESNFVESRRAALEKMLNKTAAHPTLQQDADLKLFLESETFNIDVKHKERKEPNLGESKSVLGSLGFSVGSANKFVEQDDVSKHGVHRSARVDANYDASGSTTAGSISMRSRTSSRRCSRLWTAWSRNESPWPRRPATSRPHYTRSRR